MSPTDLPDNEVDALVRAHLAHRGAIRAKLSLIAIIGDGVRYDSGDDQRDHDGQRVELSLHDFAPRISPAMILRRG